MFFFINDSDHNYVSGNTLSLKKLPTITETKKAIITILINIIQKNNYPLFLDLLDIFPCCL
jgi:hypothetical protein